MGFLFLAVLVSFVINHFKNPKYNSMRDIENQKIFKIRVIIYEIVCIYLQLHEILFTPLDSSNLKLNKEQKK